MEKKKIQIPMTVCLSGLCDRDCSHCFVDGNMEGLTFSLENALIFSREIRRVSKMKLFSDIDINFHLHLTGEGENLLNPNLVEIMDLIMLNKNVTASFVTSGARPDSLCEVDLIRKLALRPYAERINFCLSFNEFEKGFPKRLLFNLDNLFKSGIEEVVVKVCFPIQYGKIIAKFFRLINGYFYKWASSERKGEYLYKEGQIFYPVIKTKEQASVVRQYLGINPLFSKEEVIKKAKKRLSGIRLSEKELLMEEEALLLNFLETIGIETRYGSKRIVFSPHDLTNGGRGNSLDPRRIVSKRKFLSCGFFDKDRHVHLGSDGYYYPNAICPKSKHLILCHVSEDIRIALWLHDYFRSYVLKEMLANNLHFKDPCDACIQIMKDYWHK